MTELVHLDVARGVATITLDSPGNRNALSTALRRDLTTHLETALRDDAVRVLVLTHSGTVFCAGADLKEPPTPDEQSDPAPFTRILEMIMTSPKPVVTRLAGPVRAGGTGLVAACDIAVAVDSVTFAFTEVRIGVVPALISVPLRHRLLPHAARELFLTGETFDAERAVAVGLLTAQVPTADLDDTVDHYVNMLLLGAPTALAATKSLLDTDRTGPLAATLAEMSELSRRHFSSDEGREGLASYTEKRPPAWVPV
ncbi:enoyl-CoA hydratase-related protein [Mycolicibacterium thermoresistibile]